QRHMRREALANSPQAPGLHRSGRACAWFAPRGGRRLDSRGPIGLALLRAASGAGGARRRRGSDDQQRPRGQPIRRDDPIYYSEFSNYDFLLCHIDPKYGKNRIGINSVRSPLGELSMNESRTALHGTERSADLLGSAISWGSRQLQRLVPYSPSNPYLEGAFAPIDTETTATRLTVRGSIPRELQGILARIGPNPMQVENPAVYHWFTGDGMVHGV